MKGTSDVPDLIFHKYKTLYVPWIILTLFIIGNSNLHLFRMYEVFSFKL